MKATTLYRSAMTILELIRLRNAVISFIGVYVGGLVFSIGQGVIPANLLTAAVSTALILGAGNALNDFFDHEIDRINRPKRPIPSGRITRGDTLMLALAMFLIGLAYAKSINTYCLAIAAANTAMLIVYAKYSKRMLLISNLCISYLVASVFIYGAAATYAPSASISTIGLQLTVVLTMCSFLINFSREIVKDIEDIDGDRGAYSVTIPIRYGAGNAKTVALAAAAAAVLIGFYPLTVDTVGFNELIYGIFILLADIVLLASFTTPPSTNQHLLVAGMTLALISFLLGATAPIMIHLK
ncbi:MAG: UbiA family prenyltransferase [Candidatus Altiarchaeota archaeon]